MVLLAVYPENDIADNHRGLRGDVVRPYFTIGADRELRLDRSFRASVPYLNAHSRYKCCEVWLINRLYVLQAVRLLKASWTDQREAPRALSENIEDELVAAVEAARFALRGADAGRTARSLGDYRAADSRNGGNVPFAKHPIRRLYGFVVRASLS